MKRLLWAIAPVACLLAVSSLGFAGTANATFGFVPVGTVTVDTGDLMTATTITMPSFLSPGLQLVNTVPATAFLLPNDFFTGSLIVPGDTVTLNPLTLSLSGDTMPLTNMLLFTSALANRFSFTATSEIVNIDVPTRAVSLYFLGTFHDSTSAFDDAAASLTLSFNQSSPNTTINGSGTFSTPPQPFQGAPEPATMAMLGSALVGIGVFGRKKLVRR